MTDADRQPISRDRFSTSSSATAAGVRFENIVIRDLNFMDLLSDEVVRLVLVDREALLRETLTERLEAEPQFRVLSAGDDVPRAIQICLESDVDVAVLSVDSSNRDVFDAAAEIRSRHKRTRFLFLSGSVSDITIEQALRAGAQGFLLKNEPYSNLKESILRVHRGDFCFSRSIENRIQYNRERHSYTMRSEGTLSSLTNRQLEVLKHLALGQSVKEVARRMHLSEKSVDSHKYRIMNKLGIHDRVELALFAVREGLVTL